MTEQAEGKRTAQVDLDAVGDTFATHMEGKLEPATLDATKRGLRAGTATYGANGAVTSMIFYLRFGVTITDGGKRFVGDAGGISSPGGGALFGTVYTDDLNRLYKDTTAFEFQATPVYTSLLFFDSNSNLLGHFQAGAVSIVTGVGGGSGSWS